MRPSVIFLSLNHNLLCCYSPVSEYRTLHDNTLDRSSQPATVESEVFHFHLAPRYIVGQFYGIRYVYRTFAKNPLVERRPAQYKLRALPLHVGIPVLVILQTAYRYRRVCLFLLVESYA